MKTTMIALAALAMSGTTHAITSEEIANALGVDPNIATFSLGGDSEWTIDTEAFHDGTSAMKSGPVSNSTSTFHGSDLLMTIDVKEACYLTYWFKRTVTDGSTSYEKTVHVVDSATYEDGGNKDWVKSRKHILTPGRHQIKWMHQRRYGSSSGYTWIDGVVLEPIMPVTPNVQVTNIKCQQRYPWNGMVDIDYTVRSEDPNAEVWVCPIGYDKDSNTSMAPRSLTGDGVDAPVSNGTFRMTWKVTDDYPDFHSTAFTVKMIALTGSAPYMVVDLSGGVDALSYPVTYLSSVPEGGWGDEYKTTKLVLRLIPPGSFMMGSPSDEGARADYEDLHGVVLTRPYYIGVFEVTQKQYQLVMGATPSNYKGDMRPVECVSYNDIRGSINGTGWPTHNQVDANSFMGRLRSKANMCFDLPTEAQWEYACRAGTSTSLNNGKNYDAGANTSEVGRWANNRNDGKGGYTQHTKVGCYLENVWGLYDMHGNVQEWCRDWLNYGLGTAGVVDPVGSTTRRDNYYNYRVVRGDHFNGTGGMRSAYRANKHDASGVWDTTGFRVMCSPVAE